MNKVLILAYDFPPYVSVGGLRPYSWYKYLYEFGLYPVVVTRQWDCPFGNKLDYIAPGNIHQTIINSNDKASLVNAPYFPSTANKILLKYGENKYRIIRKLFSAWQETSQYFFMNGPKAQIYKAACNYLKENRVCAIIATGDPFVLFHYASKLSKKFGIPWIADYRDPWSQDIHIQKKIFQKKWAALLEKNIVKKATVITTVSDFFKYKLSLLFKNKDILVIPNGFDPEAADAVSGVEQGCQKLQIALVGTIYKYHPLRSFLQVVDKFNSDHEKKKIYVNFYGINISGEIRDLIGNYFQGMKDYIGIFPKMSNQELLKQMAENNLMLLFNYYSMAGTKIYDYLAIRRPILLCYSNDPEAAELKKQYYSLQETTAYSGHLQEDIIRDTNAGYVIENALHLRKILEQLYDEFQNKGSIQCNTRNIEKYSRRHHASVLAEIVKKIKTSINQCV